MRRLIINKQIGEKMPPQVEQVQKVLAGCRITIFNEARKILGIKEGDFVILRLEDGSLRLIPAEVKPKKTNAKKT
jgi:bifunctional DNA-binding transcriptional regulator/antitoxin component of YhaV-PrlF toxin-antitoxin module